MIGVNVALEKLSKNVNSLKIFRININNGLGYILAKDVVSPMHMPPFRQSAMDGFAIHIHNAASYQLVGEIKAGDASQPVLKPGEAVRIFTGAAVPETSDAVVMQEKVQTESNHIIINAPIDRNSHIRPMGEQVQKGQVALQKGTKLTPAAIGYLASLGIVEADVYTKPTIAIIATGNELIEPGNTLDYGQIYESNSVMLSVALQKLGYNHVDTFRVKDDYHDTYEVIEQAIKDYDVVLISGGISVGDYDFVGKVLKELDVTEVFYKVKQKPGKPLYFGKKGNTLIFGLPGNPAAALSCFYVYVYTALSICSGNTGFTLPGTTKKSMSKFSKKGDRAQFLKAIIKGEYVSILEGQSSAMLQTFALANALVYVPENTMSIEINDTVEVIPLPI